ncbi:MAG: DUF1080 domain-containing protein, partial [Verrucomicrobia bacterium]|nr:DUF1080 domain-containing protein [Verrucomicrobiota bacterium]
MKASKILSLAIATTLPLASLHAEDGWINLFNGKNLDGWEQHSGEAKYTVVDGVLTGESVFNSGVMLRAECFPEARTLNLAGKTIKIAADRVHGYQCEIDMDAARGRMWTGGIYDEARRGWLFPADGEKGELGKAFSEQGRKVTKNGEWNKLRIVANGPSIKTWLNGQPRADLTDSLTPRGIIGLQVHGVGKDTKKVGLKVSFRNVRLREIKSETNQLTEPEKAAG